MLRKNERRHFATAFLETLYQQNRLAHHVVIDESDEFAPQRSYAGVERLLGAAEDIVRRGRIRGLGVTMISQRPASLSKSVLSQVDALIVLGLTAPQDVSAVDDWVSSHSDPKEARQLKASLPSLPVGQAWVWSPEWLGVTQRIHVHRRTTFDSSATPKAGARRVVPTEWAHVDVAEIHDTLTATTTSPTPSSGANARIHELEQQLAAARNQPPQILREEIPVLADTDITRLHDIVAQLAALGRELTATAADLTSALSRAAKPAQPPHRQPAGADPKPAPLNQVSTNGASSAPTHLGKAEREILTVLAQHGPRTTTQVALLTRRSHKSGGFRNSLSKLRTAGLIEGRGEIAITAAGKDALGTWKPLPQGAELIVWWATHLGKAERLILDYLAIHPDRDVPVDEIAKATGYSPTSGGFRNSLSRLRSLELATGRGALRISTTLVNCHPRESQ